MLFGFGDSNNPRQDTVELVEELVIEYLTDTITAAARISQTRVRTDDLLHVLRHDEKKLARVEELLYMNEVLDRVRKAFDSDEESKA
ncbi:Transcription initiation factor IID, 18kDa subunit domain-containing protein [Paramicrosporidium saccamoebae]|uniref:Transcription initiation factor TFIID subunit 13 n=1 Tax=Paramicrosporidium saccamoebae TaxID=1246581 RepID=A0A2H9TJ96_9FUNG|nr:Transcription initiation factor IID, 18kDa subunit domain-containing protein [Paramicrosporidium saccamoebae]